MALTIRVLAEGGWQNGKELIPKGELRDLGCDESRIKAYIDDGVLEVVNPEIAVEEEDESKKTQELVDLVAKAVTKSWKDMAPDEVPIKIRDRSEDDPKGGFETFGDFCRKIYQADHPDKYKGTPEVKQIYEWDTKTTGHMAEYDSEQGGHLVPAGFVPNLLQNALEGSIVRPRATFIPCATNRVAIPVLTDYDHRPGGNGVFGSLVIKRPGEAAIKNPSKPQFGNVTLTLHKMVVNEVVATHRQKAA